MKKVIVLLAVSLLLTGCFGEAGKGNLTVTCNYEEGTNSFVHKAVYVIKFKENAIYHIKKTDTYEALNTDSIETVKLTKLSAEDYNRMIKEVNGITVTTDKDVDNNYTVSYNMDFNVMADNDILEQGLSKEYNKTLNILQDQGFICK